MLYSLDFPRVNPFTDLGSIVKLKVSEKPEKVPQANKFKIKMAETYITVSNKTIKF